MQHHQPEYQPRKREDCDEDVEIEQQGAPDQRYDDVREAQSGEAREKVASGGRGYGRPRRYETRGGGVEEPTQSEGSDYGRVGYDDESLAVA